ncbi:hypothetical protein MED222_06505 [Vibrio sp. MED222]|nr:hypothetical protein MED222_06505 [Vibrio sp. MED222]
MSKCEFLIPLSKLTITERFYG